MLRNLLRRTVEPSDLDLKGPDQAWRDEAKMPFTPDAVILERRYNQLVFIYDDLMKARPRHDILGDGKVFCGVTITEEAFTFWRRKFRSEVSTAIIMKERGVKGQEGKQAVFAPVRGELWAVETPTIFQLDQLYQNGVQFKRERLKVYLPYTVLPKKEVFAKDRAAQEKALAELGQQRIEHIDCFMYVGLPEYWSPMFSSGTKVTIRNGWDKEIRRISSDGFIHAASKVFVPHNANLDPYHFFTPTDNGSSTAPTFIR